MDIVLVWIFFEVHNKTKNDKCISYEFKLKVPSNLRGVGGVPLIVGSLHSTKPAALNRWNNFEKLEVIWKKMEIYNKPFY